MFKVIKEIIIMLLICLVGLLLFAVIFYEYISNRKLVAEVKTYSATDEIKQMLADDVDKKNEQVVLTYEVTSSDLNTYKKTNEYVPGKANPFSATPKNVESTPAPENNTNTDEPTSSQPSSNTVEEKNETNNNTGSYFKDNGTK